MLYRETGLVAIAYLADLLPAFPAGQPFHGVFLGVEAIRKNVDTAHSFWNDKFISTVVCVA
ncbi:MAG TPA: hypothetical protein VEK14_00050 [Rhodomicrobium sp.]|nr:hypothetical protein [Rhodomicrobium sp.]